MDCCERVLDDLFDETNARRRLRDYRRDGPRGSTRRLLEALAAGGVDGWTVLDIGGGVGAIHLGLLDAGAASAVDVDASNAFVKAARSEAERRGVGDRVRHLGGDAVLLGDRLEPADAVALDRVVCCYPAMPALIGLAAARARRRLGIVVPRDSARVRLAVSLANAWQRIRRQSFRMHAHRTRQIEEIALAAGLRPAYRHRGWFWETLVFERSAPNADAP